MKLTRTEINKRYIEKNKEKIRVQQYKWNKTLSGKLSITLNSIKNRCGNPNSNIYKYYGGKGITCLLNKNDLYFLWKRDGAENMACPSIGRIDHNKSYRLDNCEFVEKSFNSGRVGIGNNLNSYLFTELTKEEKDKIIGLTLDRKCKLTQTIAGIIRKGL